MKCVLCIPCRNVGEHLNKIFKNIERIKKSFTIFNVCFFYDNSNDNTLNLLSNFKSMNNYVDILINDEKLLNYRTHRIAH